MELALVLGLLNTPNVPPAAAAAGPPPKLEAKRSAQKNSFYEVAKYLDVGGELFVYLSAEQVMAEAEAGLKNADGLFQAIAPMMSNREAREAKLVLRAIRSGLKETGLREVSGMGASSIALRPGFYRGAAMLHRYPGAKDPGLIWTAFGARPHAQAGLKLMPASTVLAAHGDLDAAGILAWVRNFVKQNAPPRAVEEFEEALEEANNEIQIDKIIEGFGGELGMMVTLNEKRMVRLPLPDGDEPLQFPEPGFILTAKVKDDTLAGMIGGGLGELPKEEVKVDGITLKIYQPPGGLPVDIRPTLFTSRGYLVLASNPNIAREILAVQAGRSKGLAGTKEFQALAQGMKLEGNAIHFVSARLGGTYLDFLHNVMGRAAKQGALPPKLNAALKNFFADGRKQIGGYLGIFRTQKDGLLYISQATLGGKRVAMTGAAAGFVAVGAAFTLPAVQSARHRARQAQSMNNVKQLALATHIYADKHDGHLPKAASWSDDLLKYAGDPGVFQSPMADVVAVAEPGQHPCSYAYNAHLGGRPLAGIREPAVTVLFIETATRWNGSLDGTKLAEGFPGGIIVGFVDGHVERLTENRLKKLRWKP